MVQDDRSMVVVCPIADFVDNRLVVVGHILCCDVVRWNALFPVFGIVRPDDRRQIEADGYLSNSVVDISIRRSPIPR